jgi:hypothetical protein
MFTNVTTELQLRNPGNAVICKIGVQDLFRANYQSVKLFVS